MLVTVTKNLNIRSGSPYITDTNNIGYYKPGQTIDTNGTVVGQNIGGNSTWYQISNTNYYAWSGGTDNGSIDPSIDLINYNDIFSDLPLAWRATKGAGIKIAILDTGINANHVDLIGRIVNSTDSGITDNDGHGTEIAGLIGACSTTNN